MGIVLESRYLIVFVLLLFSIPTILAVKDWCLKAAITYTFLHIGYDIGKLPQQIPVDQFDLFTRFNLLSYAALFAIIGSVYFVRLFKAEWQVRAAGECLFWGAMASTLYYWIFGTPEMTRSVFTTHTLGLIWNPTLNVDLLAATVPFVRGRRRWISEFAVIYLIYKARASTPILVYVAAKIPYFTIGPAITIIAIGLIAEHFISGHFHNGAGRYAWWKFFYENWPRHFNRWFGCGVNHFSIFGPALQATHTKTREFFVYLHSDWGEIAAEQGLLGLVLWGTVYLRLLYRTYSRHKPLCCVAIGIGVTMLFYFPIHTSGTILAGLLAAWPLIVGNQSCDDTRCVGEHAGYTRTA